MSYEPKEGIDYIVDYYAVAGIAHDDEPDAVKAALNSRLM